MDLRPEHVHDNDELEVRGRIPTGLVGRLIGVHDGVVHAIDLRPGHRPVHRYRRSGPDARAAGVVTVFSGTLLLIAAGAHAYDLGADLDTMRPVDLAGRSRTIAALPRHDRGTGELHLLTDAQRGEQAHVAVSASALTRRDRPIVDPPAPIVDLAVTDEHIVLGADGFVGLTAREVTTGVRWIETGVGAPVLVHAVDANGDMVVLVSTPALERWVIPTSGDTVRREVVDARPVRFAHATPSVGVERSVLVWAISERALDTYDLATGRHVHRTLGGQRSSDFVFVGDPHRPLDVDGGWLVGLLHDVSTGATVLTVLDAADVSRPAVAMVRIRGLLPSGLRLTWVGEREC